MNKKYFLLIFFQIFAILFIFAIFEISLRLYFQDNESFNCYRKVNDERKYFNGLNCYHIEKYFEKKTPTLYITDDKGARIGKNLNNNNIKKIYFVGDSFTFGALSNYEETYPYNSIKYYNENNGKYINSEVNLGVNGYQFMQNYTMIKNLSKKYSSNLIIYGLTPNDIFDIESSSEKKKIRTISIIDKIKIRIDGMKLISIKFLTSIVLKNDKFYNFLYDNRGESAGYIQENGSKSWEKKYILLKEQLNKLDKSTKDNLLITIIPQQIQIRLLKIGKRNDALSFDKKILEICKDIGIKCVSFTEKMSKRLNYKTHFIKDGHLYPLANIEYGKLLGEYLIFKGY